METTKLKELFKFNILHRNFSDGIDNLFEFAPTEIGQKTLQSYKLHFKKITDGFTVIAPYETVVIPGAGEGGSDLTRYKLKHAFNESAKLSFVVYNNDPLLFNYSEFTETTPGDYVFYFNNLDASKRRTSLLKDATGIGDEDRVKLHTKEFRLNITESQVADISVLDCRGDLIPDTEYTSEYDHIKQQYVIDLSRKEDGLYTIVDSGETTAIDYYCTKASFIREIPFIIIELFVGPEIATDYQIIARDTNEEQFIYNDPVLFKLHFGVYSMYWRYQIIPVNVPLQIWLRIKANDTAITFTPDKLHVETLNEPLVFTSENPINLSNNTIEASLYKLDWNNQCRYSGYRKYSYCGGFFPHFGVWIDGEYMCRRLTYNPSTGQMEHQHTCPAEYEDELLGALPRPDALASTNYYIENNLYYADMVLYQHKHQGNYYISESATDHGHDDDDDD